MFTMQVCPQIYQITIRYANIFLIVEENLTLVDTGFLGSTTSIIDFIHRLGRSPEEIKLIILTHNHLDHIGGLEELLKHTKAKVVAPEADIVIRGDTLPYPAGGYLGKILKSDVMAPVKKRFLLEEERVDIKLKGGEVLPVLGGLLVIPVPGHTPGSIGLYASGKKVFFVGDALNKRQSRLRLPLKTATSNSEQIIASIRQMVELDFNILCFGHGKPMTENAKDKLNALITTLS
jgi:glyoxylase-like metal-dependent hydrolase (beta-lactamase superfamily II)